MSHPVLLNLQSAQHASGTFMPIIRSSRLYCYYSMWRVVLGCWWPEGQVQAAGYAFSVRDAVRLQSYSIPHPERRNLTKCFNININLARFSASFLMMVEDRNMLERYCVYFNINFNVFFKLIKVHLLVSELYEHKDGCFNYVSY